MLQVQKLIGVLRQTARAGIRKDDARVAEEMYERGKAHATVSRDVDTGSGTFEEDGRLYHISSAAEEECLDARYS